MYIYENHLGGNLYTSDYDLDYKDLYCEECGDSDRYVGKANTREEAYNLLKNDYDDEYLSGFLAQWIEEEEDDDDDEDE